MEVEIRIPGGEVELARLLNVLRAESQLRDGISSTAAAPDPSTMNGELIALVTAVVASPTAVYCLSRCVVTWLNSRRTELVVKLKTPDGLELTLDEKSTRGRNITDVIESVNKALGGPVE